MSVLAPSPTPPRYILDPVAFSVALVGAPFVFALFTFWAFFIPVAAIVFGGPIYLALGTPILLWVLNHRDPGLSEVVGSSIAAVLVMMAVISLYGAFGGLRNWVEIVQFYGGFGIVFAPAWAATFLALYRWLRRDFYARPRPFS